MYGLQLTTAPLSEPVSVSTLKQHLRIAFATEDQLLQTYIITARTLFEEWTQRQLVTATYTLYLDSWSNWHHWQNYGGYTYPMVAPPFNQLNWERPILLPKSPLQAVNTVKYYDQNDVLQTLSSGHYMVDGTREPARLLITNYPALAGDTQIPRVVINYTAGYQAVPSPIVHGIMLLAGSFYRDREATSTMSLKDVPIGFKALVNIYRVGDITGSYDL